MQDILLDDKNISPEALRAEFLELQNLCKELVAKNEEYAGIILSLREQVQLLKDEIAVLKGQKPKPKIPPNRLNKDSSENTSGSDEASRKKRPGSAKKNKTAGLKIDETHHVEVENVPSSATFKGWSDYTVQDIAIEKKVILFCYAQKARCNYISSMKDYCFYRL